jgi:hemolysin III
MKEKELHPTSGYTPGEEFANMLTHAIGALLSVVGLVIAVLHAAWHADAWLVVACSIYGASLILLYTASTCYHGFRSLHWKKVFLAADHCGIYLLIAGSYTPFCLGPMRGPVGWTLLGLIWSLAIIGIFREIMRPKRGTLFSTIIYLLMGWLVIGFIHPLIQSVEWQTILFLLLGGLLYSAGVVFYRWHSMKFHHAIWHAFVIAGTAFQFIAVLSILRPA